MHADEALRAALEHVQAGRPSQAQQFCLQALQLQPHHPDAIYLLGVIANQLEDYETAVERFEESLRLQPSNPACLNSLGNALSGMGRPADAERCYRGAVSLKPDFPEAHSNLGNALCALGREDEALASYRHAIALRPDYFDAHSNLGVALQRIGRIDEAVQSFEGAMRARPAAVTVRFSRCFAHLPAFYGSADEIPIARARYAAALAELRESLRLDSPSAVDAAAQAAGTCQPFYLAYQGANDRDLQARYGELLCEIMRRWQEAHPTTRHSGDARRSAKIRVGIVSQQIRRHSVWDVLTKGFVAGLDRSRFEVYGYHTNRVRDGETERAEKLFDRYVQKVWPVERWLEVIAGDAPDALFYPEIGMDPCTTKLAALRLAPLQIAAWGHPDTTGLTTIDHFLSAELFEPDDAQSHYTERLVRLPNLGCCANPIPVAEAPVRLPELGIPAHGPTVRFISCQQAFKYLPQHDQVFARIARAVGACRFVFVRMQGSERVFDRLRPRIEASFAEHGLVAADYCSFIEQLPRAEFFGLLRTMDVYLDTLLFSGFTTAFQALQCGGLPIVTLEAGLMRGRLAAGLLRRVGLTATIAKDVDEYVAIAVRLARDDALRAALRDKAVTNLLRVVDDPAPVRALEQFLERMLGENRRPEGTGDRASRSGPSSAARVWEMLETPGATHLASLKPDFVPRGLVDMVVDPPRVVLDVGCFHGATGAYLKQRYPGARVVGIEPIAAAAARARGRIDAVYCCTFEEMDFEAAGLAPETVDVAILADVLEHMYNPWRALQCLRGLLGETGFVLASIPNVRNLALIEQLARGRWRYEGAGLLDITHLRFFARADVESLFGETGYRIAELRRNYDPRCRAVLDVQASEVSTAAISIRNLSREDLEDLATQQFFVKAYPKR